MDLIKVENNMALLDPATASAVAEYERVVKVIQEKEKELREKILVEMQTKGIVKLETDEITITYIPEKNRETFDSKLFKQDYPNLYSEYIKTSMVKPSIRVGLKKVSDADLF